MFCRKNKKYYFAKKWGCHGTPGTPSVDDPGFSLLVSAYRKTLKVFNVNIVTKYIEKLNRTIQRRLYIRYRYPNAKLVVP